MRHVSELVNGNFPYPMDGRDPLTVYDTEEVDPHRLEPRLGRFVLQQIYHSRNALLRDAGIGHHDIQAAAVLLEDSLKYRRLFVP